MTDYIKPDYVKSLKEYITHWSNVGELIIVDGHHMQLDEFIKSDIIPRLLIVSHSEFIDYHIMLSDDDRYYEASVYIPREANERFSVAITHASEMEYELFTFADDLQDRFGDQNITINDLDTLMMISKPLIYYFDQHHQLELSMKDRMQLPTKK